MGIISGLFESVLGGVAKPAAEAFESYNNTKVNLADLALDMARLEAGYPDLIIQAGMQEATQQSNTNIAELEAVENRGAATMIFMAGWRPALAWAGVFAFIYSTCVFQVLKIWWPALPSPDLSMLNQVVLGLLGLGGMRTFEKLKGISTSH